MPARAIGLAVRYSELLVAEQLGNTTFGTARHITTTLTVEKNRCGPKISRLPRFNSLSRYPTLL